MKYADFLKNKRVAVIGPSQSSIGCGLGAEIDSYDVVVRLLPSNANLEEMINKNYKDVGSTTDVLYSNFDQLFLSSENTLKVKLQGVKYLNCTRPVSELGSLWEHSKKILDMHDIFYCPVDQVKYHNCSRMLKCSPHKGFSAIMDLLSYEIKELYVVGFSFYKDKASPQWANLNGWEYERYLKDVEQVTRDSERVIEYDNGEESYIRICDWTQETIHNNEKEFLFFKHEILKKDKRVHIADSLKKFFKGG